MMLRCRLALDSVLLAVGTGITITPPACHLALDSVLLAVGTGITITPPACHLTLDSVLLAVGSHHFVSRGYLIHRDMRVSMHCNARQA